VGRRLERLKLRSAVKGQREACEEVICEHYKSIYCFLVYLSGDANLSEDLTQETFISAWSNMNQFEGRASLKSWLHRIAYNKFLDSERSSKKRSDLTADFKDDDSSEQKLFDPLHKISQDEHSRILFEAIHRLEHAEYVVIVLHYIQDFSYREMANILKEPVGTIKWRTNKTLKKLREILTGRI
jgi:RNA polymerase sigma-70 factor (ECF subfamily)